MSERDPVDAAVAKARRAQKAWAACGFAERSRLLRRLAVAARRDEELVRLIGEETGKPSFEAVGFEVAYLCEVTRFLSGRAGRRSLAEDRRGSLIFPHKRARVTWQPRGVVAVIGPSNFPLLNNFGDAVAPLLAGNAVVLKPSPRTPGASRRMATLWAATGMPADVFQVSEGDVGVAEALIDACDMVFFTGSVAAGRAVAARAGQRLIPCVAELGGKAAMIVLADADLDAAARAAVWGAFAGAGEVCVRVERLLVVAAVADELVRRIEAEVRRAFPGDADAALMSSPLHADRCRAHAADATSRGGVVLVGGAKGSGFGPTLIDHVPADARVAVEETFGPVLPVVRVSSTEEAVRVANESPLALAAYVWSRDPAEARAVARRLDAGTICINDVLVNYFVVSAPLGGRKASGLGFRHGGEALRQFCVPQTIVEDRPLARPLAAWIKRQLGFPYRARVLAVLRRLLAIVYR